MFWNRKKKLLAINDSQEEINKLVDTQPDIVNNVEKIAKKIPISILKRLIPIGQLSDLDLQGLTPLISEYKPGAVIFNIGEISDYLTYLVKGQCFIETKGGQGYELDVSMLKAFYPLSSDRQHQCRAIAKSNVTVIHFSHNVLQNCYINTRNALLNDDDIPENLQDNSFFKKFLEYYKKGELVIPSLPNVALKLREAVQKDIGIKEAVKIVNLDPVISSKLIQVANSPLYRTVNPVSSCHDAVSRLGLTTTRNLVTSISMQNLFKSKNKSLNVKLHAVWKKSIHVSSICHTLTFVANRLNPDEALLAGLIHNIGALPIIIFADSLNTEEYSDKDLNLSIKALQGLIGNVILKNWGFPDVLLQIPRHTENWYHSNSEKLDLTDVVILAKFHSYLGSKRVQNLPPIHTLPAFQKLGDNSLTPGMSLLTLQNAKQQISEAMRLFVA